MTAPALTADAQLYYEVQTFYSRQMRLLDTGAAEEWAQTFTEDGVFHQNITEPVQGRAAIAVAARARVDQLQAAGRQRRHWLGMLDVEEQPDGTVVTRYYALAMATPRGESLAVYVATDNRDELVRSDGRLLVRHRHVEHDGHH